MSDERTGRELTPRPEEERPVVTPREGALPTPSTQPAERFYAGDAAHTIGLTEERAAAVVRQSGKARYFAFFGALILVLFIPAYWLIEIGLPFAGVDGQLAAREESQYVTDVARGHELYLANCARCHGENGQGGIGPVLNDQAKLYNALTPQGLPGSGHLNPGYLEIVLNHGGRWVCGDPNSLMPAWLQPEGPLNYREIEEIIAFILASNEVSWIHHEEAHGADQTPGPAEVVQGWRDPEYEPPPGATPVPECWRAPQGSPAAASPQPVASLGTAETPRVIEVQGTEQLQWVDPQSGERLASLSVVEGETIEFRVINESEAVPHNFHIGSASELETAPEQVDLPGVDTFTGGTQAFEYTFDQIPEQPQFACTVPGHYGTMHGDFVVVPAGGPGAASPQPGASPATSPAPAGSPPPAGSPASSPALGSSPSPGDQ